MILYIFVLNHFDVTVYVLCIIRDSVYTHLYHEHILSNMYFLLKPMNVIFLEIQDSRCIIWGGGGGLKNVCYKISRPEYKTSVKNKMKYIHGSQPLTCYMSFYIISQIIQWDMHNKVTINIGT